MTDKKTALVLYGATDPMGSNFSSDMFWRMNGFLLPDSYLFIEFDGKTYLVASSLEMGRAVEGRAADVILSYEKYEKLAGGSDEVSDVAVCVLQDLGVNHVVVPDVFPCKMFNGLKGGVSVEIKDAPFYPARARKSAKEIEAIRKAQGEIENAISEAIKFLRGCEIKGERIYHGSVKVTSETVKRIIDGYLYERGYLAAHTIVASGLQAADPHEEGSGPLLAHSAIIIDVFPRSMESGYFGDMTRTVFKGDPPDELKAMYLAVLEGQELGLSKIKSGVDGYVIWEEVIANLTFRGFPTDADSESPEGFFHGVGHGLGVEIHEPPRISKIHKILEEGNVVTVEPGLYYAKGRGRIPSGGIRIEDAVVVTENGCENLNILPKDLDRAIIS